MKTVLIAPTDTGGNGMHIMRIYRKPARHGFEASLLKVTRIPIWNLKSPSFAIFGAVRAPASADSYGSPRV